MAAILFFFSDLLSFQEFLKLDNVLENSNWSSAETLEKIFCFSKKSSWGTLDGSRLTQNSKIDQKLVKN